MSESWRILVCWQILPKKVYQQSVDTRNLHFLFMRTHKWESVATLIVDPHSKISVSLIFCFSSPFHPDTFIVDGSLAVDMIRKAFYEFSHFFRGPNWMSKWFLVLNDFKFWIWNSKLLPSYHNLASVNCPNWNNNLNEPSYRLQSRYHCGIALVLATLPKGDYVESMVGWPSLPQPSQPNSCYSLDCRSCDRLFQNQDQNRNLYNNILHRTTIQAYIHLLEGELVLLSLGYFQICKTCKQHGTKYSKPYQSTGHYMSDES